MFKIHHFEWFSIEHGEWFSIEQGQDNSGVMLSVTDLGVKKRGKEERTPLLARGLELRLVMAVLVLKLQKPSSECHRIMSAMLKSPGCEE